MSRFPRLARYAAAGAFAVSALTVVAASPASAATGSIVAASNGFTVTFTGTTTSDHVDLLIFAAPHTCATNDIANNAAYVQTSDVSAPAALQIAASPTTFTYGSSSYSFSGGGATTIAAGSYVACLQSVPIPGTKTILGSLAVTIADPATTTTTTAAPTTTTTAAGVTTSTIAPSGSGTSGDPAVPTFTG